jgi:hypothetical protein
MLGGQVVFLSNISECTLESGCQMEGQSCKS